MDATRNEMEVESVRSDKDKITVVTTGARYVIDKSGEKGKISCYQLLNEERLVATLDFEYQFSSLSVKKKDEDTCILLAVIHNGGYGYLRLQVNSDSLLDISSIGEVNLTFSGKILPQYAVEKDGNILLIDESGGIGVYPYQGFKNVGLTIFGSKKWKADYTLGMSYRFLVSVFPPRRFNYTRFIEDGIAHHGIPDAPEIVKGRIPLPSPFPSDEEIEEAGRYTNILVLHERIWQGNYAKERKPLKTYEDIFRDASPCCFDYVSRDEEELARVIKKAHSLDIKVIPYMSPYHSTAKGKDFLDRVEDTLKRYDFDGVYFDGISFDILYSYRTIRDARALLKNKILYVHCSIDPIGRNIYCPFIDTHADYILRAESITNFGDKYLRYVISGYNISNSIGHICYSTYPLDFIRELIPKALAANVRFYLGSPETEREKLLKEEYFPKLKKLNRQLKGKRAT